MNQTGKHYLISGEPDTLAANEFLIQFIRAHRVFQHLSRALRVLLLQVLQLDQQ